MNTTGKIKPLGRTRLIGGFILCAAVLLLIGARSASAAEYCVDVGTIGACPAGTTASPSLTSAIASTNVDPSTSDTIYIASGTYGAANGFDFAGSRVKVKGVGPTKPIITLSGGSPYDGDAVIKSTSTTSSFENLSIVLPASTNCTGYDGLAGGASLDGIDVSGSSADESTGVAVSGQNPEITNGEIDLDGDDTTAILFSSASSAIADSLDLTATAAIRITSSQNFKFSRITSHSGAGVKATRSSGTISSSLLAPSADPSNNVEGVGVSVYTDAAGASSGGAVRVDNSTLIGDGTNSLAGILSAADNTGTSAMTVNSSIIKDFTAAARTDQSGSGAASISLAYSRYTGTTAPASGGTVTVAPSSTPLIDAGFISGGFDLSLASALVDAGDPGALDPTDSASDVAGNPRVVSRGAGNVRDIGAYEVQNHAPVPVIAIQTSVPSTTVQTQFSAAGSSDADGDAVTYDWRFDGTSFATGVAPKKLFNTDGPHSVQLTVTDKTGAASISSTQFIVAKGHLALRLTSRNARMSSSGTFKVRISCPELAATDCTGRILFTTVKKIQANHYYVKPSKKKQAAKILSAANYVFRVQPGTTATGTVRAYRTFRNVLNKKGKLQLQTSVISGTTANAILDSNRTTFNISAPKKK